MKTANYEILITIFAKLGFLLAAASIAAVQFFNLGKAL
jgi:hypothetical protein